MKNINFVAKPGQKIAIVGSTGAGKTTLINLLMRFYEVNGGQITIDGTPTTDLTRKDLRHNFGMVLQDTWLFGGTVSRKYCLQANLMRQWKNQSSCKGGKG